MYKLWRGTGKSASSNSHRFRPGLPISFCGLVSSLLLPLSRRLFIFSTMSSAASTIYVLDSEGKIFAKVPTPRFGRPAAEVGLFLEVLSGGRIRANSKQILLRNKRREGHGEMNDKYAMIFMDIPVCSDVYVVGGIYSLSAVPPVDFRYADLKPVFFPSSRQGSPMGRDMRFRENVVRRDGVCVVSGCTDLQDLRGCHIIPTAWQKRNLITSLPPPVCDHILGIGGIDDVRNGFLASRELHEDFDRGRWSVMRVHDRLCFFGIDAVYCSSEYHGRPLHISDRTFPDGQPYADLFPDELLWKHHFTCSVFRHMRRQAEVDPADDNSDIDEPVAVIAGLEAELREIDVAFGNLEGTVLDDFRKKMRSDAIKEAFGSISPYGVPSNIPPAYE
ncbi:hypothetical protein BC832DRAFT_280666 [Gaertneriomyces semiglobifer]|nr:hypothetical protein BC832DRAFT_280666 [Gaertneriomyces semiglobifer]